MDSPPFLVDQYAAAHGVNALTAKRAMILAIYAAQGTELMAARSYMHISKETAYHVCRRFLIDFPDYRPYALLEKQGKPRPEPVWRIDLPADGLPLWNRQ